MLIFQLRSWFSNCEFSPLVLFKNQEKHYQYNYNTIDTPF